MTTPSTSLLFTLLIAFAALMVCYLIAKDPLFLHIGLALFTLGGELGVVVAVGRAIGL